MLIHERRRKRLNLSQVRLDSFGKVATNLVSFKRYELEFYCKLT